MPAELSPALAPLGDEDTPGRCEPASRFMGPQRPGSEHPRPEPVPDTKRPSRSRLIAIAPGHHRSFDGFRRRVPGLMHHRFAELGRDLAAQLTPHLLDSVGE